jgi:putative ABC transport system permease protein
LNGMAEFKWVNEYLVDSVTVEFDKEKIPATVTAIDITDLKQKWQDINIGVSDGRLFSGKEKFSAVIGINIAKEAFKKKARINNKLLIGGKEFTIIGILNEVGNPDDDSSIMLPIDTFRDIFNKPTDVSMIELVVKDGVDMQRAADKVKRKLERAHDENDFEVLTPEQLLNQLGNVLLVVQVVLVGIAAISLVVGALGIMNTMYTSVTERTNEIGIMKSIGAKNVDILLLFLVESGIIGLVGGLLGIACGVFISSMVSLIAKQAGFGLLLIKINMPLMAFSLGFAFFMGTISGLVPAVRASRLRPAEALGR